MKGEKRVLLEKELTSVLSDIATDTKALKRFYTVGCKNFGWNIQEMNAYITCTKELKDASDYELFLLYSIYLEIKETKRSINKYFDEDEISEFTQVENEDKKNIKLPITIKAIEIKEDKEYVCCMDSVQLLDLYQNNLLCRKFRDRNLNKTTMIKIPAKATINQQRYVDLVTNKDEPIGEIILGLYNKNINKIKLEYNHDINELTIDGISYFDIIDGQKRILAMLYSLSKNRKNCKMSVRLLKYDKNTLIKYIAHSTKNYKMLSELYAR